MRKLNSDSPITFFLVSIILIAIVGLWVCFDSKKTKEPNTGNTGVEIVEQSGEVFLSKEQAVEENLVFDPSYYTTNHSTVIQDTEFSTHMIGFFDAENKMIGALDWDTGVFIFQGRAKESAHLFFEHFLKSIVSDYIDQRLGEFVDHSILIGKDQMLCPICAKGGKRITEFSSRVEPIIHPYRIQTTQVEGYECLSGHRWQMIVGEIKNEK